MQTCKRASLHEQAHVFVHSTPSSTAPCGLLAGCCPSLEAVPVRPEGTGVESTSQIAFFRPPPAVAPPMPRPAPDAVAVPMLAMLGVSSSKALLYCGTTRTCGSRDQACMSGMAATSGKAATLGAYHSWGEAGMPHLPCNAGKVTGTLMMNLHPKRKDKVHSPQRTCTDASVCMQACRSAWRIYYSQVAGWHGRAAPHLTDRGWPACALLPPACPCSC